MNATLALFLEDERHVAKTVPAGAIITIDGADFNGEKLVNVTWDGKAVMMFTEDLRARSERVAGSSVP